MRINSWEDIWHQSILIVLRSCFYFPTLSDFYFFKLFQMGYVVAGVSLVAPLACSLIVSRFSRKRVLLMSTSVMSAAMIFQALLIHFQADIQQVSLDSWSPIYTIQFTRRVDTIIIFKTLGANNNCDSPSRWRRQGRMKDTSLIQLLFSEVRGLGMPHGSQNTFFSKAYRRCQY